MLKRCFLPRFDFLLCCLIMNKYAQMFAASSVSASFSSFKQHAGWRQADRGGCCCGSLFWGFFSPPYRRMIKAAQHNAEKDNVKKALQGLFDTLCSTVQAKQYTCCAFTSNTLYKPYDRHWRTHSITTPVMLYFTYIIASGNGFTTAMTKTVAFSADKLCDFVSQIV